MVLLLYIVFYFFFYFSISLLHSNFANIKKNKKNYEYIHTYTDLLSQIAGAVKGEQVTLIAAAIDVWHFILKQAVASNIYTFQCESPYCIDAVCSADMITECRKDVETMKKKNMKSKICYQKKRLIKWKGVIKIYFEMLKHPIKSMNFKYIPKRRRKWLPIANLNIFMHLKW